MRFLAVALAVLAAVRAQDPEGFPTRSTSIPNITPSVWASSATAKLTFIPSYSPPPVSWTTITSEGTAYQVAVAPRTTTWTTVMSRGSVLTVPVSASSTPAATPTPAGTPVASASAPGSHKTRTIVLSVIFSFVGAVLLLLGAMFFMRVRAQRKIRTRRSWAMRPGGWAAEKKDDYPYDAEFNATRASFPEPEVPAPVPSHTRQRSL